MSRNGLNNDLHNEPDSKRRYAEWKHTYSPVKKRFWVQPAVKKKMLTVFWDMKGVITIDFQEKGASVNSAFYCQYRRLSVQQGSIEYHFKSL